MSRSTGSISAGQVINDTNAVQIQGVDVSSNNPLDTQVLAYNLANTRWEPTAAGGGGANATQLQGVNISATLPTDTQVLTYNSGAAQWEPADAGSSLYAAGTVDLYISQATGNDANDGLSSGQAVATWGRLLEIGSGYDLDEIIIHLVSGETYTNWAATLDTSVQEYDPTDFYNYTQVLDFSPLGARSIKIITDLTGQTNTPTLASAWSTTTGGPGFYRFTHAAITTGISRWIYSSSNDNYLATEWYQNTATDSYAITWNGAIGPFLYYDNTEMATVQFNSILVNAPNKVVVFERTIFDATTDAKLVGDFFFKGSSVNMGGAAFLSGYELNLYACYFASIIAMDGVCNVNNCFSDDTIIYNRNATGNLSYCYIDTLNIFNNSSVYTYFSEYVGGNIELGFNATCVFSGCGATVMTLYAHDYSSAIIDGGSVFQTTGYNMVRNSNLTVNSMGTTCATSVHTQSNSVANISSCDLTSISGTQRLLNADEGSHINVIGGSIADVIAGAPSAIPFITADDLSTINVKANTFNTVTNRSSTIIQALNGSKIWLPNTTFSSALTTNHLIDIDKASTLYLGGSLNMNTSQNMIHLQGASTIYSTSTPTNSGAGTVLQRGTTLAGAWVFDTTGYTGVATDQMTLVLSI